VMTAACNNVLRVIQRNNEISNPGREDRRDKQKNRKNCRADRIAIGSPPKNAIISARKLA